MVYVIFMKIAKGESSTEISKLRISYLQRTLSLRYTSTTSELTDRQEIAGFSTDVFFTFFIL